MPKYVLTGPHKALMFVAYTLFAFSVLLLAYLAFLSSNLELPRPIRFFDLQNTQQNSAGYQEQLITSNEFPVIKWYANVLLASDKTALKISDKGINISSGSALIYLADHLLVQETFTAAGAHIMVNANTQTVYVLNGNIVYQGNQLPAGSEWNYKTGLVNAKPIDRSAFNTIPQLKYLQENHAVVAAQLPWLTDFSAPKLTDISPAPASTVTTSQIQLVGETDDPQAKVSINRNIIANANGKFETTLQLVPGSNLLTIELSDEYGNVSSSQMRINYFPTATP